jgi:2'-5' RNA ligase
MSPLPAWTRDRWENRAEPREGHGTIYWHILAGNYPEFRRAATEAQDRLSVFSGLHMTPADWLHVTTLVAGSTGSVSREHMAEMLLEAEKLLSKQRPINIRIGRILYHPEAIMLRIEPPSALDPILQATRSATLTVTGSQGQINGSYESWTPHATIAYSTAAQPATPLIETLGTTVGDYEVVIKSVSLVIQWGPERLWSWEPVGTVHLGTEIDHLDPC